MRKGSCWVVAWCAVLLVAAHVAQARPQAAHVFSRGQRHNPTGNAANEPILTLTAEENRTPGPFPVLDWDVDIGAGAGAGDMTIAEAKEPVTLELQSQAEANQEIVFLGIDVAVTTIASMALQAATMAVNLYKSRVVKNSMTSIGVIVAQKEKEFDDTMVAMDASVTKLQADVKESRAMADNLVGKLKSEDVKAAFPEFKPMSKEEVQWHAVKGVNDQHGPQMRLPEHVGYARLVKEMSVLGSAGGNAKPDPAAPKGDAIASQLEGVKQALKSLEDIVKKAEATAKSQAPSAEALVDKVERLALDTTLGQLRPENVMKELLKLGLGAMASVVNSVLTLYLGVIWNAIAFVNAVSDLHKTKQACKSMVDDYKAMGDELIVDLRYTICRSMTSLQYQMLVELTSVWGLAKSLKERPASAKALPKAAADTLTEVVGRLETEMRAWEGQRNIEEHCGAFLDAAPAAFSGDLLKGDLIHKGVLQVSNTLSSYSPCFCFIPHGGAYLHCTKVTAEQAGEWGTYEAVSERVQRTYDECMAKPNVKHGAKEGTKDGAKEEECQKLKGSQEYIADVHYQHMLKWLVGLVKKGADYSVHLLEIAALPAHVAAEEVELQYPSSKLNVFLKATSSPIINAWIGKLTAARTAASKMYHSRDPVSDKLHMLVSLSAQDLEEEPKVEQWLKGETDRESRRMMNVRTEYADEIFSVVSKKLSPDAPEWQKLVEDKLLVQTYRVVSPASYFEENFHNSVTSIVSVPVGEYDNNGLIAKTTSDEIAGPFHRATYRFVGHFPGTAPAAKPENFVVDKKVVIPKLLTDNVDVKPTHELRMAFSTFPGAPISAIATFPIKNPPAGWVRVGYLTEHGRTTDPKCYFTRFGRTHSIKDALFVLRDYRILTWHMWSTRALERSNAWNAEVQSQAQALRVKASAYTAAFQTWYTRKLEAEDRKAAADYAKHEAEIERSRQAGQLNMARDLREHAIYRTFNTWFRITLDPVSYENLPGTTRGSLFSSTIRMRLLHTKPDKHRSAPGDAPITAVEFNAFTLPHEDFASGPVTPNVVKPMSYVALLNGKVTLEFMDEGIRTTQLADFVLTLEDFLFPTYSTTIPNLPAGEAVLDVDKVDGKSVNIKLDITKSMKRNGYTLKPNAPTSITLKATMKRADCTQQGSEHRDGLC